VVDMSTDEDSPLMTYIKRRRAINRRAAAKSRARLREHVKHVKQVCLYGTSTNSQLAQNSLA